MVKVKRVDEPRGKSGYPKLMESGASNTVVLFTRDCEGFVVQSDGVSFVLGHRSDGWDMSWFVDFNGSITLSNEV